MSLAVLYRLRHQVPNRLLQNAQKALFNDATRWSWTFTSAAPGVCVLTSCSYTAGATYPSADAGVAGYKSPRSTQTPRFVPPRGSGSGAGPAARLQGRKKLSTMALSKQSPTVPIDGWIPTAAHRSPKRTDVYWQP